MNQLFALLISLTIEVPIVLITLLTAKQVFSYVEICHILLIAYGATIFTHPLAWEVNEVLIPYMEFPVRAILIETAVILAEGTLYWIILNLGWRRGLFLSLIANVSSFSGGLLIYRFLFYM